MKLSRRSFYEYSMNRFIRLKRLETGNGRRNLQTTIYYLADFVIYWFVNADDFVMFCVFDSLIYSKHQHKLNNDRELDLNDKTICNAFLTLSIFAASYYTISCDNISWNTSDFHICQG